MNEHNDEQMVLTNTEALQLAGIVCDFLITRVSDINGNKPLPGTEELEAQMQKYSPHIYELLSKLRKMYCLKPGTMKKKHSIVSMTGTELKLKVSTAIQKRPDLSATSAVLDMFYVPPELGVLLTDDLTQADQICQLIHDWTVQTHKVA